MSYVYAVLSIDDADLVTVEDLERVNQDRPISICLGVIPLASQVHLSVAAAQKLADDLADVLAVRCE